MNNLALTIVELAKQKNDFHLYEEAEHLYLSTLARRKVILGDDHPLVVETKNDLGCLYYIKHDLDKAEMLFEEIYEKINENVTAMNRRALTAINNFANIHFQKGNLDKAHDLFKLAYDQYIAKFGSSDLDSLTCCHNMGSIYFALERHQEAAFLLETCLQKRKKILSETHASTLATMNLLGLVYCALQQYTLAEPLLSFVVANKVDHVVVGNHNTKAITKTHQMKGSPISPNKKNNSPNSSSKNSSKNSSPVSYTTKKSYSRTPR